MLTWNILSDVSNLGSLHGHCVSFCLSVILILQDTWLSTSYTEFPRLSYVLLKKLSDCLSSGLHVLHHILSMFFYDRFTNSILSGLFPLSEWAICLLDNLSNSFFCQICFFRKTVLLIVISKSGLFSSFYEHGPYIFAGFSLQCLLPVEALGRFQWLRGRGLCYLHRLGLVAAHRLVREWDYRNPTCLAGSWNYQAYFRF